MADKKKINDSWLFQQMLDSGLNMTWDELAQAGGSRFAAGDRRIVISHSRKATRIKDRRQWRFNFAYHRDKPQDRFDFAVCVIHDDKGGDRAFVFPAKLAYGKTITITEQQLVEGRLNYFKENWRLIDE